MSTYRRILATFVITLSCLFTIQSAAALTTPASASLKEACVDLGTMPVDYTLSRVVPTGTVGHCGLDQTNDNTLAGGSLCGDLGDIPGNRPQSSVLPAHAGSACSLLQPNDTAVASGSLCGDVGPLPGNSPQSSVLPAHAGSACVLDTTTSSVAVAEKTCSPVGPMMYNLGLGSITFAAAPACVVVNANPGDETGNATAVHVPIEGSITAMNGEPALATGEASGSAEQSSAPDVVRGRASFIGPTI